MWCDTPEHTRHAPHPGTGHGLCLRLRTARQPRPGPIGLGLLLLLALYYLFGAISDLAAVATHTLPSDHRGSFTALADTTFGHLKAAAPGVASYLSLVERGYALHEITFALLFIVLLAIPFRQRQR